MMRTSTADIHSKLAQLSRASARALLKEQIEETEAQISQLAEHLEYLKKLCTQHSETAVLPPEVLALILTQAVTPSGPYDIVSWRDHVQLTAVCRTWRAVALETPSFWVNIPVSMHSTYFLEALARAKQLPLSVRLSERCLEGGTYTNLGELELRPEKWGELHVQASEKELAPFWGVIPPVQPLSSLRSMRFRRELLPDEHSTDVDLFIQVPEHMLTPPLPQLQHLELSYCDVSWDALARGATHDGNRPFQNLITLHLQCIAPPPPTPVLVGLLSSSHHMESVQVSYCIPDDFATIASENGMYASVRPASRPKTLCIEGELWKTVHLARWYHRMPLEHRPTTTNVSIDAYMKDDTEEAALTVEQVHDMTTAFFEATGLSGERSPPLWGARCPFGLTVSTSTRHPGQMVRLEFRNAVSTFKVCLPMRGLEFALQRIGLIDSVDHVGFSVEQQDRDDVFGSGVSATTRWRTLFQKQPQIKTIAFTNQLLPTVLAALIASRPEDDRSSGEQAQSSDTGPILPSLQTIQFEGVKFNAESISRVESLLSILATRRAQGVPYPMVDVLEGCQGSRELLKRLEEAAKGDIENLSEMAGEILVEY